MSEGAKVPPTGAGERNSADSQSVSDLCWRNVIKINLEARQQASSSESAPHNSLSSLQSVGYNKDSPAASAQLNKPLSEVIVVSDEENTPSPDSSKPVLDQNMSQNVPNQQPPESPEDLQALRELLQKEEKKLSVLKTIHGLQGGSGTSTMNNHSSIQGSALNKTSGRSTGSGSGRNSPNLRAQNKHSIVVVPGNQTALRQAGASTTGIGSSSTGISSRLQQLVDNISVDQAMNTDKLQPGTSNGKAPAATNKLVSVTTPAVPGLTSLPMTSSPRRYNSVTPPNVQLSGPKLKPKVNARPSHEIITITDSLVGKRPPPLLSSSPTARIPTATSNGSIQVPTISSSGLHGLSSATVADKKNYLKAAENSRRYREYLLKQTHARKNFQKQIERKMVVAPYPKTFRQVWPLIPVHDSSFVRNFGMESVIHHFDPESKSLIDKNNSKVKPICNQCGCDFASAWQIRKSNSKQLLLCEACDFQNLKILQRSKLSNQLKELLDSIKEEQVKFISECEEARKMLELEKQVPVAAPPPLNSQLGASSSGNSRQLGASSSTPRVISQASRVVQNTVSPNRYLVTMGANAGQLKKPAQQTRVNSILETASNPQQKIVIPSILGHPVEIGTKRAAPAGQAAAAPPSKVYKPGSVLDLTLNRLSKQLIKRKLDEKRQECPANEEEEEEGGEGGVVVVVGGNVNLTSPTSPAPAGQRAKNRRKGTPKHKRLLSGSSE